MSPRHSPKGETYKAWTLYKAHTLNELAIGLEACEMGGWTVFQVLHAEGNYTILSWKVVTK